METVKSSLRQLKQNTDGFAALFGVITFSLLLVSISVSSSRLAGAELRQASNVDRSDRALKAAEAGLEEALQRIDDDLNSGKSLDDIFAGTGARGANGDMAILLDQEGLAPDTLNIVPDTGQDGGALAWRNRAVRESSYDKIGYQVKDEIIEVDLSALNELDRNNIGDICGTVGSSISCSGTPLHPDVSGFSYCPTNIAPPTLLPSTPEYEIIVVSYGVNNPADIRQNRIIQNIADGTCYEYQIPSMADRVNRRYIFRIKPIFKVGELTDSALYSEYKVSYKAEILTDNSSLFEVAAADNSILIDVTGESGDVRRRILAVKQRNGRLLGVFDYLLYSGDEGVPLCKAGVLYEVDDGEGLSYNLNKCDDGGSGPVSQPPVLSGDVDVGCTQKGATNISDTATIDDGSCVFAETFNFAPVAQSWTVPSGVNSIEVELFGAAGGNAPATAQGPGRQGGEGAIVKARLSVTPGETLYICTGGRGVGGGSNYNGNLGGFNGGGRGGSRWGASGGGATDIRTSSNCAGSNNSRILVAAGGGGADGWFGAPGGDGGSTTGQSSGAYQGSTSKGGTTSGGGSGGCSQNMCGSRGGLGSGGNNAYYPYAGQRYSHGGGGGGGYFGGGGGSPWSGGGGGSNLTYGSRILQVVENARGGNASDGRATITSLK